MDDDPEKAAGQKRKEKCKSEKPRETELMPINKSPDDAESQAEQTDHGQNYRQTRKSVRFEIFALGHRDHVRTLAHFFGASGFGSALVSAGLSRSARCSGGTSASVAFWLRCSARR